MNEPLVVREFDTITGNADFSTDEHYKYLPQPAFDELVNFIHEFTANERHADALDLLRIGYKRHVGDVVTIRNYVGLIQMRSGVQVEVLPKISLADDSHATAEQVQRKTKAIFLRMLRSLKNFPATQFNDADLDIARMNLYEIFINMYLEETRQLLKHGLRSAYITQEDNLRFYKGKLQVPQQIKLNAAHQERFYMTYDEYHPNRPENRLVKATLLKLQKLTTSAENEKEIRQLLTGFELVDPSTNYDKDFFSVSLDRSTEDYEILLQWSMVFLKNRSFTTFTGEHDSRALLFPMETVYESYVAQQMKKILSPAGWQVSVQDNGFNLFDELYEDANKRPRPVFKIRPDIVCKRGGRIVIMDTKWKSLVNNEKFNYGIFQTDMYQMYAYSKKYMTVLDTPAEVWLLYPVNDEMRGHAEIKFDSGDGTTVRLHFVDVETIPENLKELKQKLES